MSHAHRPYGVTSASLHVPSIEQRMAPEAEKIAALVRISRAALSATSFDPDANFFGVQAVHDLVSAGERVLTLIGRRVDEPRPERGSRDVLEAKVERLVGDVIALKAQVDRLSATITAAGIWDGTIPATTFVLASADQLTKNL